jgi:nitrate/nitrite-specific signal transduction histidine kinase
MSMKTPVQDLSIPTAAHEALRKSETLLQERARFLGGHFEITSSPSHGTNVQLRLRNPRS